jgi:DNA-directed RNA polymerase specialized sigma24 family protein
MKHPFAVEIFERFLKGESIRELADELQIPADRVELRLRAAALYMEHQAKSGPIELPSRYRDRYGHSQ